MKAFAYSRRVLFSFKKKYHDFYIGVLRTVWNVQKSGIEIVYFDTRGQNGRLAHCKCSRRVHAAFLHLQWANRPSGLMYRTIFFFTNSCEPELAHRLQTSKMRRNSTSLDSCQHDDINIVTVTTVSVARRRWTAPLKPRRPCVKHFTTFYAPLKQVSPKGDYFIPKGHFFAP